MTPQAKLVLIAIKDIFFASKLQAQAGALGLNVQPASPQLASQADLAIVHLGEPGVDWEAVVRELKSADPELPILAFGRHTDAELLKRAQAAGCTKVVANSAFATELLALTQRYARRGTPGNRLSQE